MIGPAGVRADRFGISTSRWGPYVPAGLFLVGGAVWFGKRRYRLSGTSTALGTFFKLFPARAFAHWLIRFAEISAVVMVPFLAPAPSNTLWSFRFNSLRQHKDSLGEVLTRIFVMMVVWAIGEPQRLEAVGAGALADGMPTLSRA